MSKRPNGETTNSSRRLHDDVALSEIELYDEVLSAVAAHDGERVEELLGPGSYLPDRMTVSIYIADESIHAQVEVAVEQWLNSAGVYIFGRGEPVMGSWFKRIQASIAKAAVTPAGREAALTATHIADTRLVQAQDAYVTATLLQNVGPVLQALQPTKDAVVRAGALLIVKIDWAVQVHQLTAVQQAILDHQPNLVASPKEIAAALQLHGPAV
jgi:hypothetical protein